MLESLLVWLLVVGLFAWLVYYIVGLLPIPAQIKNVVLAVLGVLLLIAIIERVLPLLSTGIR